VISDQNKVPKAIRGGGGKKFQSRATGVTAASAMIME